MTAGILDPLPLGNITVNKIRRIIGDIKKGNVQMDVIEITRELGKAIQADPRYCKYLSARSKNDADEELQQLIGEFNMGRMQLNREMSKQDKDQDKISEMNLKIRDIYGKIMENPNMAEYNDAKAEFDDLMIRINGILQLCANGEDPATCEPSNCTGSCATCGGCH